MFWHTLLSSLFFCFNIFVFFFYPLPEECSCSLKTNVLCGVRGEARRSVQQRFTEPVAQFAQCKRSKKNKITKILTSRIFFPPGFLCFWLTVCMQIPRGISTILFSLQHCNSLYNALNNTTKKIKNKVPTYLVFGDPTKTSIPSKCAWASLTLH